jgi:hypothetical protein
MAKRDRLYVRATSEQLTRWKRAARAAGATSMSALARDLLDAQPAPELDEDVQPVAPAPSVSAAPRSLAEPGTEDIDYLAEIKRIAQGSPR